MADEAFDSLRQTLTQILNRDDVTRRVKQQILSILPPAGYLQLNLKNFPDEEKMRQVASTAEGIVQFLFSPANLSDCGVTEPTARLSKQLGELAAALESTAGDVADCISKLNSLSMSCDDDLPIRSSNRLVDDDLPIIISNRLVDDFSIRISNRLIRLVEKIMPTAFDEDLSTELAAVSSSSTSTLMVKDAMVGFEKEREHMIDQLVSSSSTELQFFAIIGMTGIGKSKLAKTIYDCKSIVQHFDIRAWITPCSDTESVAFKLLALLKGEPERGEPERAVRREMREVHSPMREVYNHLWGKRYLIVLDVDDTRSLLRDDMYSKFPDNANGSRIMLTTRLMNVTAHFHYNMLTTWDINRAAPFHYNSIHMRFLDEQESWDLFQREVFADQTCPPELLPVAKRIVKSCGGLPLSIVTLAGLLSRFEKNPKLWQQVQANDVMLATISSSEYSHLDSHLRQCFLYMAGFPENYEIHASELIKLWVAEGFVERPTGYKSLEQVGEDYLAHLVNCSLALVISKKSDGKIKTCKLHSTMRDFCTRKAEQDKLILPVLDYLPTPILRKHFLPRVLKDHKRMSATWYDLDLKDSMHSSCTQSIICIPQKGYKPKASVWNFTSLKILHVLRRNDGSYWEMGQLFDLIHLTYIASNIPSNIVPPAISKLQNLQSLIIYRHEVHLPVEIWRLRRLRHLIAFSFHPLPDPEEESLSLRNLRTLCLARDFVCSARMVEMIPNIKKLGIFYSEDTLDDGYCLENLSNLFHLDKLKLERRGLIWPILRPVFPKGLKKLALSGWRLPWKDLAIVALLRHLEVLKLRNYACDGESWVTMEGGFQTLKLLLIDESNLHHWITESRHFPRLQCLMLHRCPCLSEIPSALGEIPTLTMIEIDHHHQSLLYKRNKWNMERTTFKFV